MLRAYKPAAGFLMSFTDLKSIIVFIPTLLKRSTSSTEALEREPLLNILRHLISSPSVVLYPPISRKLRMLS